MQSPPFPRYLVPPRSRYSPQHHVLKHPQLPFLHQCQRPSFTPIHNNRQNYTRVLCSVILFSPENRAVYEIMWKNMVGPDRPQMTIWRMRIACWIAKAKIQTCSHCIPMATVVMRTRFSITLYVHCLPCKVSILATRSVKEYVLANFGSRRKVWKPPI